MAKVLLERDDQRQGISFRGGLIDTPAVVERRTNLVDPDFAGSAGGPVPLR